MMCLSLSCSVQYNELIHQHLFLLIHINFFLNFFLHVYILYMNMYFAHKFYFIGASVLFLPPALPHPLFFFFFLLLTLKVGLPRLSSHGCVLLQANRLSFTSIHKSCRFLYEGYYISFSPTTTIKNRIRNVLCIFQIYQFIPKEKESYQNDRVQKKNKTRSKIKKYSLENQTKQNRSPSNQQ